MVYVDDLSKKHKEIKKLQTQARVKPRKKIFFLIILIIIFIIAFLSLGIFYDITKPVTLTNPVTFQVKKGESIDKISRNLKDAGIIRSLFLFKLYLVLNNKSSEIKSGTFIFSGSFNIVQVVNTLTSAGKTQNQITFWEGMRIEEMALYLENKGLVKSSDFIAETKKIEKYKAKYVFLQNLTKNDTLEGFLFPDTYKFDLDIDASGIIDKMLENFHKKFFSEIQSNLAKQNKEIKEVLTLASIIEREVKTPQERAMVAGIYYNRLARGMKLEADPTVQYAKETETPPQNFKDYWKRITTQDYRAIISPYNTYLNAGLPPAPICNPGLVSIKAVLNPSITDYLYFFTTDGEIYYSRSAAEHANKKTEYLK